MCPTPPTTNYLTTKYSYGNDENEFILCCKGRPFAVLVSPHTPTPTSTLLDYDLARSLGLKLTNLQCRKYSFAGYKLRVLGTVTTAVQCVQNGKVGSTFHLRCDVVADLYSTLDTHCVASAKLQQHLGSQEVIVIVDDVVKPLAPDAEAPPGPRAAACAAPPRPTTTRTPPAPAGVTPLAPTPSTPPQASPCAAVRSPRSPRSPPGFPASPQHAASLPAASRPAKATVPVRRVVDGITMSPYSANIRALSEAFNDADLQPEVDDEIDVVDPNADADILGRNDQGDFHMILTNGLQYTENHGRHKCSRLKCPKSNFSRSQYPSNCGYHPQWILPEGFKPCGDSCKAAFCPCLRLYNIRGGK